MLRWIAWGGIAFVAALYACTGEDPSVIVVNNASDGGAASSDASSKDDGSVDAGVANLLDNGDFELGSCEEWIALGTTIRSSVLGRNGGHACEVCSKGEVGGSVYGIAQQIGTTKLASGTTYVLSAWVRAADPDAGALATAVHEAYRLDESVAGPATYDGDQVTTNDSLGEGWQELHLEYTYDLAHGTNKLDFQVINRGTDDGCFLVDDASINVR